MKVTYEFNPNDEDSNDEYELKLIQSAHAMCSALQDLDNIRRDLYKGYKYYDPKEEEESKFSKINVNLLLEDIYSVLSDSKYIEFE